MVETILESCPALANARRGRFGADRKGVAPIALRAQPEGHVIQVLGAPGCGDIVQLLEPLGDGGPWAVRTAGPGNWLVIGDSPLSNSRIVEMEARLDGLAALVDQSHGRVRIAVWGEPVEAVLAKGIGVDLCLSAFQVGRSAMVLLGAISIHITRTGPTEFELVVPRSFARHVWDDIISMAREFGGLATVDMLQVPADRPEA